MDRHKRGRARSAGNHQRAQKVSHQYLRLVVVAWHLRPRVSMASKQAAQLESLSMEIQAPVARLTLHNPPLNVLDLASMAELASALTEIEGHSDISVVVLSGAGKNFSAGVDVAAHS